MLAFGVHTDLITAHVGLWRAIVIFDWLTLNPDLVVVSTKVHQSSPKFTRVHLEKV